MPSERSKTGGREDVEFVCNEFKHGQETYLEEVYRARRAASCT
jgi:hypothetical protein